MAFPIIPVAVATAGTAVTGFISGAVSSFFNMIGKEEETEKASFDVDALKLVPEEDRSNVVAYQEGLNPNSVFQDITGGGFVNDYTQTYTPTVNDNKQYSYTYVIESPGTNITTDQTNTQEAKAGSSGSALSGIVNNLGVYAPYIAVAAGAYFLVKGLGSKKNNYPVRYNNGGYYRPRYYNNYGGYTGGYNAASGDGSAAYWQYRDNRDARRFDYRMSRRGSIRNTGQKYYKKGTDFFRKGTDYIKGVRSSFGAEAAALKSRRSAETSEINGGIKFNE